MHITNTNSGAAAAAAAAATNNSLAMAFTCSFCMLVPGRNGRRDGPGKCRLTNDNVAAAKMLLKQQHPRHTQHVDLLVVMPNTALCLECFPQALRDQMSWLASKDAVLRSRMPAGGLLCQKTENGSTSWEFHDARPHLHRGGKRTLQGLQGWKGWRERGHGKLTLERRFEEIALRPPDYIKQPRLHDSILLMKGLVSQAECAQLIEAAEKKCRQVDTRGYHRHGGDLNAYDKGLRRFELHPDGINHDGETHALAHAILARVLWSLEQQEPELCAELFRAKPGGLCDWWLTFKGDEPMLNQYTAGGLFPPHQDGAALTVLVPLSTCDLDFEGGGTAFWSEVVVGKDPKAAEGLPPSLVMKPPPGTALFWRGHVTHAGLPVTAGCRHVFVASFDLHPPGHL